MTRFELETWDAGRLIVNRDFAELLRHRGWLTFATIWSATADAAVAKNVRTDRVTRRFMLDDHGTERAFYIKRHSRWSLKEYLKHVIRLTWPLLGARNEWNAILEFHAAGLPTMTPVALGRSGSNSFLITESLESCTKLSDIPPPGLRRSVSEQQSRSQLIRRVAQIARTMHAAGLHHQDFYLGHLLVSRDDPRKLYVIDLGRVLKKRRLASRWIVKDLGQLNFSANATNSDRLRFFREYLGRPLTRKDLWLIRRIQLKTALINRHSRKNRL